MGTLALIGLGSNLGDRKATLDLAVASLSGSTGVTLRSVSRYHETAPVGGPAGQGAFLNAAAALETSLEPEALLDLLNAIERHAGRVRSELWGERTLDLDLLLYGSETIDTPRLRVPHPWLALRRFVLAPLAEIAPEAIDPGTGRRIDDLLANLDRRPSYLAFATRPDLGWAPAVGVVGHGIGIYIDVVRALAAATVERRAAEIEQWSGPEEAAFEARIQAMFVILETVGRRRDPFFEHAARWLQRDSWSAAAWGDRWVVSSFWFDGFYLPFDTSKTARARSLPFFERLLEARRQALPPTFVVARRQDRERFGLSDPDLAWQAPLGRDTPIVWVNDYQSPDALEAVLAACAATRSG